MASEQMLSWLALSLLLFSVGLYGLLTLKNMVRILISVELMLNAAAMNLVIFNRFLAPSAVDGQVMALFVIALAAAEVLAAMAILVMLFRQKQSADVTLLDSLRL